MGKTILIADDEMAMRHLIRDYLVREGFKVLEAKDGVEALEQFSTGQPDLVVLDVMMPGYDGWSVLRKIRETSQVPVVMLTARDEEDDEIFGFEMGADEYVSKPFTPKILIARIRSVLKRGRLKEEDVLEIEGIQLDRASHRVWINGEEVEMSPKEYDLLKHFMENKDIAISREKLLNAVWGYDYYGDLRTVDTHVKRLRSKLKDKGGCIQTIRTVGYRFGEIEDSSD